MDTIPLQSGVPTPGPNNVPQKPWGYGDIMTMHEMAKSSGDPFFQGMSLHDFSQYMNQSTGTQRFNAGITSGLGGLIKQTETGVEQSLQPLSEWGGKVGGKIGGVFGSTGAEIGREGGAEIPRMVGTMIPLLAGSAIGGPAGAVLGGAGLASQFGETYTKTGSPMAGAISAAAIPAMGAFGSKGAEMAAPAAKGFGSLIKNIAGKVPGALATAGGKGVGRTVGEVIAMELAQQAESLTSGNGLYNPATVRHAAELLANVLPYKMMDVPRFVGEVKTEMQHSDNQATQSALGVVNQVAAQTQQVQQTAAQTARREQVGRAATPGGSMVGGKWTAEQMDLPLPGVVKGEVSPETAQHLAAIRSKFVPQVDFGSKLQEETGENVKEPFGLKGTPTEKGVMLPGNTLLQKLPTVLPKAEWENLKSAGLEDFLKNKRVTQQELNQWVVQNGPKAETPKFGEGQGTFNEQTVRYKDAVEQAGFSLIDHDKVQTQLNNLMRKDVPDDQLREAAANLANLPVKKGEDLHDWAAREAGIDPAWLKTKPDSTTLFASVENFGRSVYGALGYDQATTDQMVGNILRVASRFSTDLGTTKLVESTDTNLATDVPRGKNWMPIVGLLREQHFGDDILNHFGHLWALGHELTHQDEFAKHPEYLKALDATKYMTPEEMQSTIEVMIHGLTGDKTFGSQISKFYGEYYKDPNNGRSEFVADYAGLVAMGAAHPKGTQHISDMLLFGNQTTQSFAGRIVQTLSQAFETLKEFTKRVVGKRTALDDLYEATNKMLDGKEKAEAALNGFLAWSGRFNHQPGDEPPVTSLAQIERWRERVSGFDQHAVATKWPFGDKKNADPELQKEIEEGIGRKNEKVVAGGKRLSSWQVFFEPMRQLVREVPAFEPAVDLGHMKDSMAKNLLMGLWQPFSDGKGGIDYGFIHKIGKEGGQLNVAHREIALAEGKASAVLSPEDRMAIPQYARLSAENRTLVDKFLAAESVAYQQGAHVRVEAQKNKHIATVAKQAQRELKSIGMEEAERVGRNFVNVVWNENPHPNESPPEMEDRQNTYGEAIQSINKMGLEPEVSAKLLDLAHDLFPSFQEFQKFMLGDDLKGKPWYHSEVRPKEFHVAWVDKNDQPHHEDYSSKKEAQSRINEVQAMGITPKSMKKSDIRGRYAGMSTDMLNIYAQADQKMYEVALQRIAASDPEYARVVEELRSMFQPGEGAAAQMLSPEMRERKFVAGRERLNMVDSMIHYLGTTAHSTAKGYVADRIALALNSPGLRENDNYYNWARTYLETIAHPEGHEYTTMKNLIFMNYLGFNPSSNLIVFLHQALRHSPELVRQGFGIGESYAAQGKSFLTVGKARLTGKYDDAELGDAVARARELMDKGVGTEIYSEADLARLSSRALIEGRGPIADAKMLLGNGMYAMTKMSHNIYGLSTQFNAESAFVSAYSLAKSRGATPEGAYKFATDTIKTTTQAGGVANRPLELQGLGKMQGEGGLFYNLMSYEMGAIASMARYVREAIGVLPSTDRPAARKAAGLMLSTQVALGGALGLPFVDGLMSIIDNLFPQAQVRLHTRQAFQSLAGQDQELGHNVADFAMRGTSSLGALGLGTRLELGKLFNVDPKTGKWDLSEELLGPLGSLINNWTKGTQMLGQGRYDQAALAVAPNGIKGLLKQYIDQGDVRDAQRRILFEPTPAEKTFEALGFRTRRLNDYYEEQQLHAQSELVVSERQQKFAREVGSLLVKGDYRGAHEALLLRQHESPPGSFDILAATRAAVQSAQDQMIPVDPSRTGSRANATTLSTIGGLFAKPNIPSETQRLQQRLQMTAKLGIPGSLSVSPTEFKQASMVDEVMRSNLFLSRVEAMKIVERALQPRSAMLRYGPQPPPMESGPR